MFTLILSIGGPIDKAVRNFKVISFFYTIFTISAMSAIIIILFNMGFYPNR
jgi:hypothetical protein